MALIEVKPVETKREQKQFFDLPWKLYQGDPNWVPPLRQGQKELLGFKPHPFHDNADMQTFLALQDGQPCGRIAAIVNHAHNRQHHEQRGFFGFFESVDDQEVANQLLDATVQWAADKGMTAVRGPLNPSINYEIGLLVDGFDSLPTFMMTYNHPYYESLIEGYGFQNAQNLYAYWGHVDMLEKLDKKLEFIVAEATRRFKVNLRPMDRSRFGEEVRLFLRLYNESSTGVWCFSPMSEAEVDHAADSLRHLICPEMTSVAEIEGRPVGAAFGLLDYNPRIKKIDGRLYPFGFMRLLWNRRSIKRVRMVATEVIPEYQRWGLGLLLLSRILPDGLAMGMKEVEFSWVAESNHLSRASLERGGAKRTKTYRAYDYEIPAAGRNADSK